MKQLPAAAVLAAWGSVALLAQQSASQDQTQPPTFRSAVDLVSVDVSIIDKNGAPVTGLMASDFVLTIDGKPRHITSAQYISASRDVVRPVVQPEHYSSNASAGAGRLIMIVVDQANIGTGRGRFAMDGVSRFVARLNPADRVALVAIPGAGPQIDFTDNHALIRSLLPRLVGQATPFEGLHRIGIAEAERIGRGDEEALRQVVDRDCTGTRDGAALDACRRQVAEEAHLMYASIRERARNSLIALRYVVERLAVTSAPKTIIFISEGLVVERDLSELTWLGPAAARGQLVLHVLQLEGSDFDASISRLSPTLSIDKSMAEEGLGFLAGLTRGSVMRVVSNPDFALNRLALELSGFYLVGFEPEAGDRDGKSHKIKITVPGRSGIDIRARSQFVVEPVLAKTTDTVLGETLRAPLLSADVQLKLTTYTLREPVSGKPRILIAAEIDRSLNPRGRLSLAYVLLDSHRKVVSSQIVPDVTAPIGPSTRSQVYIGSVVAEAPGVHTIKLAVVDEDGKRGSVEHTFKAQLSVAGPLRLTDLVLAESGEPGASAAAPAVSGIVSSDVLHGYLELYSDTPDALRGASVVIEVAENDQSRPLDSGAARFDPSSLETPDARHAQGSVPIGLLPPGDYVARAVVTVAGRRAGEVVRPFKIVRANTVTTAGGARRAVGTRPAIPFSSRVDAFDRRSVLDSRVVGFFLDRMNFGPGGAPGATSAMTEARAGKFDAAAEAMKAAGNQQLATTFLAGLARYASGDLEGAASKFRESVRLDPEFFPAAFYLGSCYAAGGRDREAVGAWQTSLITESDAPFIYTLLGDALLRLREVDQAVDILKEAAGLWPDNDQVQLRLGAAYSAGGKPAEALDALEPYLAKHPEDQERLFLVLRMLYEAGAAGRVIRSREADRALFDRYASAYAAANGPQQAIVEQWKKFVNK